MNASQAGSKQQERLSEWRAGLLQAVLIATGVVLIVTAAIATAFRGELLAHIYVAGAAGLFLLALSPWVALAPRALGYLCVLSLFLTLSLLGLRVAWDPAVVAGYCALVVVAGLVVGKRAVIFLVLAIFCLMLLGGFAMRAGQFSMEIAPPLQPGRFINWVRAGAMVIVVTGATAWALQFALKVIRQSESIAQDALEALRKEVMIKEDTREKRVEREAELRDAQRLQTAARLGQGFAHMLNNVLTVVRSAIDAVHESEDRGEPKLLAKRVLDAIGKSAHKTRDLLLLTRPHTGTSKSLKVNDALRLLGETLPARLRKNIHCELDLGDVGAVMMPPSWLSQMTMNLILNAEQALPEGGRIILSTRVVEISSDHSQPGSPLDPGAYVALRVVDSGAGITADDAMRACEPFFTTKGREAHDGLGLTISYGMARELGGTLDINSCGEGTCATIYLPVSESAPTLFVALESGAVSPLLGNTNSARLGPLARSDGLAGGGGDLEGCDVQVLLNPRWKEEALERLLQVAAVVSVSGIFLSIVLLRAPDAFVIQVLGVFGSGLLGLAAWRRRWELWSRFAILLSAASIFGTVALLELSFLNPAPVSILVMVVLVAAVYAPRIVPWLLVVDGAVFLGVGWVYTHYFQLESLAVVSPGSSDNWFRFSVTVVPLFLTIAFSALNVFDSARTRIAAMNRAQEELAGGRRARRDETEALARVEEMSLRATRMEAAGHLVGAIAHDLNNCLQTMGNGAELYGLSKTESARRRALDVIQQSTNYAEALVQKLQLSETEVPRREVSDLTAILLRMREVISEIISQAGEGCELVLKVDSGCYAAIDELSLRRLVLNLVTNARDALPKGGVCRICLGLEPSLACGEQVILSIEDDGAGMDEETRAHLFEPFYSTKGGDGTGLGLHSVREIVDATDGSLDIWSEKGGGSRFTFRWALKPEPKTEGVATARIARVTESVRLLLAEDDQLVRESLSAALSLSGYQVTEASDGDMAARLLDSEEEFDIFCTDGVMPGLPTPELIERFAHRFPSRPVVLISGYLPDTVGAKALKNESVSYLHKPFSIKILEKELQRRLSGTK